MAEVGGITCRQKKSSIQFYFVDGGSRGLSFPVNCPHDNCSPHSNPWQLPTRRLPTQQNICRSDNCPLSFCTPVTIAHPHTSPNLLIDNCPLISVNCSHDNCSHDNYSHDNCPPTIAHSAVGFTTIAHTTIAHTTIAHTTIAHTTMATLDSINFDYLSYPQEYDLRVWLADHSRVSNCRVGSCRDDNCSHDNCSHDNCSHGKKIVGWKMKEKRGNLVEIWTNFKELWEVFIFVE